MGRGRVHKKGHNSSFECVAWIRDCYETALAQGALQSRPEFKIPDKTKHHCVLRD